MRFGRRSLSSPAFLVAGLLSSPLTAAAQERIVPSSDTSVFPARPRQGEPAPAITFKDAQLTVNVQDRSIVDVLDRISRATRIAIVPGADFSGDRISIAFEHVPLEEGLRQILAAYDSFFFFGVREGPTAALRAVWVYPRGRAGSIAPVPPEKWATTTELRERLAHGSPEDRAAAIEALVEREGSLAQSAVASALVDAEPRVRTRALYAATTGGVDVPPEVLMQALVDPSVDMRFLALQTLATGPLARTAAERARYDASPLVRRLAEQVLRNLDPTVRRREPAPPRSQTPKR